MPHPSKPLLDEFEWAIDHLPPSFPALEKQKARDELAALAANAATREADIEAAMMMLGRASWAHRKAFETIHERYGKEKEAGYFRGHVSPALRKRYDEFPEKGISVHEVPRTPAFEEYFTPEEKFQIQEAVFEAHEQAWNDVAALVTGPKQKEYEAELQAFGEKQERLEAKLRELRSLADQSPKWASEILDKVRVFELGFLGSAREPDERILEGEIDYYRNIVQD